MRAFFREIVLTIVFAVVIFFLLQVTVQSFIVVGISMKPSLENGQRILVSKATYYLHEPERGDILVFQPPEAKQDDYIKRIIALPGDTVEIKENRVYVNGSQLEEDYIKSAPSYKVPEMTIP